MFKRHVEEELAASLDLAPIVLLTGARQTGKTTLAEAIAQKRGYSFTTFDDEFTVSNAKRDPSGWLSHLPKPIFIDEVQRVPEILLSIKQDVDQNPQAGRYLLTSSANRLDLTDQMKIISIFPFSQGEIRKIKESFISLIFHNELLPFKLEDLSQEALHQMLLRGGFLPLQNLTDTKKWVHSYLQKMMERDIRDLSNVEGLREFPRIFHALATRSAQLLNISELSRSLGMVNVTVHRYLRLLETLYLIHLLPAWVTDQAKRLTKSPKLHLSDTALLGQLGQTDNSQFLESFIFSELLKQRSWAPFPFGIYHFRDGDHEVDLVLEKPDGTIVGIEVKSTQKLHSNDLKGLKHLQKLAKNHFKRGIVLHPGTQIEHLEQDLWAMPIQALWVN